MHQVLIIETTEEAYSRLLNQYLKGGYRLVAGSNYIKSLPTSINVSTQQKLDDIDHIFSIALFKGFDNVVHCKDLDIFRSVVNKQLTDSKVVVGSLYIEKVYKESFERCKRIHTTYYSCCVYKEY